MAHAQLGIPRVIQFSAPPRAVFGVVQVATDLTMDLEGALLVAQLPHVQMRFAKIAFNSEEIVAETFIDAFETGNISNAVKSLCFPATDRANSGAPYITRWGLSCTSMSFTLGRDRLLSCFPDGAAVTDMWQGVLAAFAALQLPGKKIAVLLPYVSSLALKNHQLLEREGYEIVSSISLGLSKDVEVSAVTPEYLTLCVQELVKNQPVDLVFIGCSALRACMPGYIDSLEKTLQGVPVVTSTQAFLWHMIRQAGIQDKLNGYGILFTR